MIKVIYSRRKFLETAKLGFVFLLTACKSATKKVVITLNQSFISESFKNILPITWNQKNIKFSDENLKQNSQILYDSNLLLINDGWVHKLNLDNFQEINQAFIDRIDNRSKKYLTLFDSSFKNKLFPIGVIPYAVVIKNQNKYLLNYEKNWDFLLSKTLKGKIIMPNSPRIIFSISQRINIENPLNKLLEQVSIYDDQHALDWLINTEAVVAIIPLSHCKKYLNVDSRLSLFFPNNGVPLMWNFLLIKSDVTKESLFELIEKLENKKNIDLLANEGWYLPFNNVYSQSKYDFINTSSRFPTTPSKNCWDNSWSFQPLTKLEKIQLEEIWNKSSTP